MTSKAISPFLFFEIEADCHYLSTRPVQKLKTQYCLPDFGSLDGQEDRAEVFTGWNENGLYFQFAVTLDVLRSSYTKERSDSIELFIDTRNLKTARLPHRFCHHFLFERVGTSVALAKEVTRFRGEDHHALCDPALLQGSFRDLKDSYFAEIYIPAACLFGFDPAQTKKLGFMYRIKRYDKVIKQFINFSIASADEHIDQHPHLWANLSLIT